jgi:2-amino-4-hydroxy-6-hydroxymethyldihydropteridine diphosphokinase
METIYLGLGSNVGDRLTYLVKAVLALRKLERTTLSHWSGVYETEPVGVKEQDDFLNMAVEAATDLNPGELYHHLKEIEMQLGRKEQQRWGPREIDIDLLLYGDRIIKNEILIIPHPEMHLRKFVLIPVHELAPEAVHPVFHRTIGNLLSGCSDNNCVGKSVESTELLFKRMKE